jgi:hypothetical protein
VKEAFSAHEDSANTVESVLGQLEANGVSVESMNLGPELTFDPATETFTGSFAQEANAFVKPPQREEFAIPEEV